MKVAFIFLVACIAQSQSGYMQRSTDILKYSEFLENSVDGEPEPPVTEELRDLQPEWERSNRFEGDIILTPEQIIFLVSEFSRSLPVAAAAKGYYYNAIRNSVKNSTRLWPDGIVIYEINEDDFDEDQIKAIKDAMMEIENVSCILFQEKTDEDKNYVNIKGDSAKGCASAVGFVGKGAQTLNLAPNEPETGCFRQGTIIHELLHAIGFYHMQSTHNRDDYVKINWDVITTGREFNFVKYNTSVVTNLGTEYDYGSILHYSEYSFSSNGSKTIEPLMDTDETIGQRDQMTETDILKINRLYECIEDDEDYKDNDYTKGLNEVVGNNNRNGIRKGRRKNIELNNNKSTENRAISKPPNTTTGDTIPTKSPYTTKKPATTAKTTKSPKTTTKKPVTISKTTKSPNAKTKPATIAKTTKSPNATTKKPASKSTPTPTMYAAPLKRSLPFKRSLPRWMLY